MRDGRLRRALKRVALWHFRVNVGVTRGLLRLRGEPAFRLGGQCRRCGTCCEAPSIRAGWAVWRLPTLRRLFLAWQRRVNGFELVDRDIGARAFVFRCTHFDGAARRCDCYDSRPGMCRDYPRALLFQTNPQFLPGCGHRPVARNAAAFLRRLEREDLSPEQIETIRAKLHMDE